MQIIGHDEIAKGFAEIDKQHAERIAKHLATEAIASPVTDPITTPVDDIAKLREDLDRIGKRDRDAIKRLRYHVIFIVIGIILTSVAPLAPVLIPFVGIIAGIPSIAQEVTDTVKGW